MGKADIAAYAFQPGHPGGPGRPKGSRAKLSELAATLLYENFTVNGAETIETVRKRKPEVYLASVIALLPKQAQKVESPFVDISDQELEALEAHLAAVRAKLVQQVDGTATEAPAVTPRGRVANTAPEGTEDSASRQETLDLTPETDRSEGKSLSAEPCVSEDDAA